MDVGHYVATIAEMLSVTIIVPHKAGAAVRVIMWQCGCSCGQRHASCIQGIVSMFISCCLCCQEDTARLTKHRQLGWMSMTVANGYHRNMLQGDQSKQCQIKIKLHNNGKISCKITTLFYKWIIHTSISVVL